MVDVTAAVIRENGGPFELENLILDDPRPDEVLVRLVGTGLCHTDVYFSQVGAPPAVFGHEGAGIVEQVGQDVHGFAVGDRVLMSYNSCGACAPCRGGAPAYCEKIPQLNGSGVRIDGSKTLHTHNGDAVSGSFFSQSSFATYSLAYARNLVHVPADVSDDLFPILGPLGCGVQTGAGAAMNSLKVHAGSSVIVSGGGSVGLSAVLGAQVSGATTIIVIDIQDERLATATALGATHVINGLDPDVTQQLAAITGGGADYAIDTTGNMRVIHTLVEAVKVTGTVGLIALSQPGAQLAVDYASVQAGRTIRGIIEGDSVPQDFIPRLIALHLAGKFPFDNLVKRYPFDQIQQAVSDTETGGTLKAVLTF
jgi:aryl-alcohol dehydrogenase